MKFAWLIVAALAVAGCAELAGPAPTTRSESDVAAKTPAPADFPAALQAALAAPDDAQLKALLPESASYFLSSHEGEGQHGPVREQRTDRGQVVIAMRTAFADRRSAAQVMTRTLRPTTPSPKGETQIAEVEWSGQYARYTISVQLVRQSTDSWAVDRVLLFRHSMASN
jgi:hypothetical protein